MSLRLVMMGTGRFALPTFRGLYASAHEVVALYTQPDRTGRGHHRHVHPLKDAAIEHHTPAKLLACLPTIPEISIPSRHLGLQQGFEQKNDIYLKWAKHIESHMDLKFFFKLFKFKKPLRAVSPVKQNPKRWRVKEKSEDRHAVNRGRLITHHLAESPFENQPHGV